MKDINKLVGNKIRKLRELKGLSQDAFADSCGLYRTYIGGIERGERNITLKTLQKIADALNTSIISLME